MESSKTFPAQAPILRNLAYFLSIAAFTFCSAEGTLHAQGESAGAHAQPPPPEVGVIEAKAVPVPQQAELPGRATPIRTAEVRARVAGILLEQVFREGTDVKKDELLFKIDPTLFKARVASAQANIARANASIARANANARQAELLAKRYQDLINAKAVSQQELDNAVASDLQAKAEQKSAEAELKASEAALQAAQLDLDYTEVRAPISGRIGRALVTEGALVGQNEATPLALINQVDPMYVDFIQPANELSSFKQKVGANADWSKFKVTLLLDNRKEYKEPGKLMFSEITVDPGTSSVTLRTEFANPDWMLWPGMYLRGLFEFDDGTKAYLVPQQAVMRTAEGAGIYIVDAENKLAFIPIPTAEVRGPNWVVRQGQGLKDGDKIVVEGAQRVMAQLRPGSPVTPMPWSKDAPKAAAQGKTSSAAVEQKPADQQQPHAG